MGIRDWLRNRKVDGGPKYAARHHGERENQSSPETDAVFDQWRDELEQSLHDMYAPRDNPTDRGWSDQDIVDFEAWVRDFEAEKEQHHEQQSRDR